MSQKRNHRRNISVIIVYKIMDLRKIINDVYPSLQSASTGNVYSEIPLHKIQNNYW